MSETQQMIACLRDRGDKLCSDAAAEIERLTHGVREISRFLGENRPGDASFVCAALLADEQQPESKNG